MEELDMEKAVMKFYIKPGDETNNHRIHILL